MAATKMQLSDTVTLQLRRDTEWDQWIVEYRVSGQVDEPKSYYTDDKQDALQTMGAMAAEYHKQQNPTHHYSVIIRDYDGGVQLEAGLWAHTYREAAVMVAGTTDLMNCGEDQGTSYWVDAAARKIEVRRS